MPSADPTRSPAGTGAEFVPGEKTNDAMTAIDRAPGPRHVDIPSVPPIEEVRRLPSPMERVHEELHRETVAHARKVYLGRGFSKGGFVTATVFTPLDRAAVEKRSPIATAQTVSKEWADLGAELDFIPLRERFAVVVADGLRGRGEDVPDRIHRIWDGLRARKFDRATVTVVATDMDRSTSNRVAKARAYVVKAPKGFTTLGADARLDALRHIFPAPKPVAAEETAAKVVADKDVTKRYLKRNARYSREDVAKWRERYASPAGHD